MLFHRLLEIANEMDRFPHPEYFSFDVIGEVFNFTSHKCLPYSPHSKQFHDDESLNNEDTSSGMNSDVDPGLDNDASAGEQHHWCENIAGLLVWVALIRWWFFSSSDVP